MSLFLCLLVSQTINSLRESKKIQSQRTSDEVQDAIDNANQAIVDYDNKIKVLVQQQESLDAKRKVELIPLQAKITEANLQIEVANKKADKLQKVWETELEKLQKLPVNSNEMWAQKSISDAAQKASTEASAIANQLTEDNSSRVQQQSDYLATYNNAVNVIQDKRTDARKILQTAVFDAMDALFRSHAKEQAAKLAKSFVKIPGVDASKASPEVKEVLSSVPGGKKLTIQQQKRRFGGAEDLASDAEVALKKHQKVVQDLEADQAAVDKAYFSEVNPIRAKIKEVREQIKEANDKWTALSKKSDEEAAKRDRIKQEVIDKGESWVSSSAFWAQWTAANAALNASTEASTYANTLTEANSVRTSRTGELYKDWTAKTDEISKKRWAALMEVQKAVFDAVKALINSYMEEKAKKLAAQIVKVPGVDLSKADPEVKKVLKSVPGGKRLLESKRTSDDAQDAADNATKALADHDKLYKQLEAEQAAVNKAYFSEVDPIRAKIKEVNEQLAEANEKWNALSKKTDEESAKRDKIKQDLIDRGESWINSSAFWAQYNKANAAYTASSEANAYANTLSEANSVRTSRTVELHKDWTAKSDEISKRRAAALKEVQKAVFDAVDALIKSFMAEKAKKLAAQIAAVPGVDASNASSDVKQLLKTVPGGSKTLGKL